MNKQQLAAKIWESANQMRSKIEANEYKDYILGFIFYKYLCDKEEQFALKEGYTREDLVSLSEDDRESVEYFKENLGFFIAYDNLFSTWVESGADFDVSNVRDALSAFERLISPAHKKLFDGIFETLQTGLSKLGESAASQTKAISQLIHLIKDIPMNSKQDYDVLGFIYEYLISMFAATAGKKAGEFYTPHEVSVLMSEIVAHALKDRKEIQIYDPTSGSGSLLINIGNSVAKHMDDANNIKYFAQELTKNTYNLTRMNLVMRGILPNNIHTRNGDTLKEDWPYFDENDPVGTYDPLYIDAVVSNPPYSQKWDSTDKESDPRYARFGLAPKTKADYAFLLHDLYHLKPDGIMTIVLPHGVLFRGGEEGAIRKNLLEQNHIDAIIGLPANIFFGTGIPTIILVLKQQRENSDTLIIDASKGFLKVGKNNKLRASDIKKIADTIIERKSISNYSKVVSLEEIRDNEYNLNIPRYVDSSEEEESYDIYATMFGGVPQSEIAGLQEYWEAFATLKTDLFEDATSEYTQIKCTDVHETITTHSDVVAFKAAFDGAFKDFGVFLKQELIENAQSVKIQKAKRLLSDAIFQRLEGIALIDKYEAYQMLSERWAEIAVDLEIIQSEGFDATKQVDANMILKKKNGKEQEVQEGYKGYILPFSLAQEKHLSEELQALKAKELRLTEITARYEEILDSLSEEEKEQESIKESKDAFINAVVVKEAKLYRVEIKKGQSFEKESYESKIIEVDSLISEEKKLKKELKEESAALHLKTKETLEQLSNTEAKELLELKWIAPLTQALYTLPDSIVENLSSALQNLTQKYETTLTDIEEQIGQTQGELSEMIGELEGAAFDMKGLEAFAELLEGSRA